MVHFPVSPDDLGQPAASSGLVLVKYEAARIFCALPSSSVGVSLRHPRCSFPIRSRPVSVPLLLASTVSRAGMSLRLHLQPDLDQAALTAEGSLHHWRGIGRSFGNGISPAIGGSSANACAFGACCRIALAFCKKSSAPSGR
jgi:hypothetical protein